MDGHGLVEKTVSYGGLLIREYVRPDPELHSPANAQTGTPPSFYPAVSPRAHTAANPQPATPVAGVKRKRGKPKKQQPPATMETFEPPLQEPLPPPTPAANEELSPYECIQQQSVPDTTPSTDELTVLKIKSDGPRRPTDGTPLLHLLTTEEIIRMQKNRRRGRDFIPGWKAAVQELKDLGRPVPEAQLQAIRDNYLNAADATGDSHTIAAIAPGLDSDGPAHQIEVDPQPEEALQSYGGYQYQQPPPQKEHQHHGNYHHEYRHEQYRQQPEAPQYGYHQRQLDHYHQPSPQQRHVPQFSEPVRPPTLEPPPQNAAATPQTDIALEDLLTEQQESQTPVTETKPGRQYIIPPGSPSFTLSTPAELLSTIQTLIDESASFIPTPITCTLTLTPSFPLSLPPYPASRTEPATPAVETTLSALTKEFYKPASSYIVSLIHSVDRFIWNVRRSYPSAGKWRREWVCNVATEPALEKKGKKGFDCQGFVRVAIAQDGEVVVSYRHHPVHLPPEKGEGRVRQVKKTKKDEVAVVAGNGDQEKRSMMDLFKTWVAPKRVKGKQPQPQ